MADTPAAAPAPPPARPDPERPFIGRRAELETLHAALERAVAGQPRIVLLAGEPGIGKTRTAQQLVEHAARQAVLALWGRCSEEPGAPPYWPWLQLIRRYVALHDEPTLAQTLGPAAAQIAALDPNAVPGPTPGPGPGLPADADATQARFRLFDAIAGFWQRAAARQPLLLVIDDLHRADVPSLRLLDFVLAEAGHSRLMVLGTYRDSEVVRQHPLSDTLAQLHRHTDVRRLLLGGFNAAESAQFVAAAGVSSAAVAAQLHEQTEGHPLFLAELTRDMRDRRDMGNARELGAPQRRVPKGVREVIGSRLNRLAPQALSVLQHAAVIGRAFDVGLLGQLLEPAAAELCRSALDEAQAASLIDETADSGAYQFAHALIRDTLYDELPAAQRALLHQRIARTLESMHDSDLTPCLSALAHHWHAAGKAGDVAKAIEYATRAAQRATATLAHEEAARHYRLACGILSPAATADAQRCGLLLGLGEAQNSAGDSAGALVTFTEAAACARRLGAASLLARAAIGFGNAQWRNGSEGGPAALLIQEALAVCAADDSRQRVLLLSALCRALLFANRPDAARSAHREAVALARRLGDPLTLYDALSAIMPGRWYAEGLAARIEAAREGLELMRQAPDLAWPVSTFMGWHTGDLMESGDTAGALSAATSHYVNSKATGEPFNEATALAALTMIATHEGRFAEAESMALQTLRCGERFDRANAAGIFGVQMFMIRRQQGRLGELAPVLRQFLEAQAAHATWRPGLAILHCEVGSRDAAREVFEGLAAGGFGSIANDAIRIASLGYLAEVCAWLGDSERAAQLFDLLLPYAERNIVFGAHTASLGAAARLLGLLAATLQRWDTAQRHFEFALELDARSGGRPWLVRSRCNFAAMLMRRAAPGDHVQAQGLLAAALEDAGTLGMAGLQAHALALQRQPAQGRRPAHRAAGLSDRELQVLRLVAAGKTNQEIADTLHRSPATVAIHVRNILGKTQAANRAEAAAFAAAHGLLAP